MNEKLQSELSHVKKENLALKNKLDEMLKREKSYISKINSLKEELENLKTKQPPAKIKIAGPVPSPISINTNSNSVHVNERSLKKKSKSKEDISPQVKLINDMKSCKNKMISS